MNLKNYLENRLGIDHQIIPNSKVNGNFTFIFDTISTIKNLKFKYNRLLLLDIETTGLSYEDPLFLCGFIVVTPKWFRQEIFINLKFPENEKFTSLLKSKIEFCDLIITYNGTCFDLPRIENTIRNYHINRSKHLDLYFLIKSGLELSRKLEHYKSEYSLKDESSAKIPEYFINYLNTGDKEILDKVVIHNGNDLMALFKLLKEIALHFENVGENSDFSEFEYCGNLTLIKDMKLWYYRKALARCFLTKERNRLYRKIGFLLKSNEFCNAAIYCFKKSYKTERKSSFELHLHYYKIKNYDKAYELYKNYLEMSDKISTHMKNRLERLYLLSIQKKLFEI
ncbi:MAG: ribonuclease H-like domain-containing protein [Candidatus Delongbacteria bacterium]|nr:ribonuclease H-like domain-containing protein [Candidatus Delongbacteria bacterium]MBN2834501.1 ribonuclease H-like domain-containing protein [Candidatus Delongbacteria bacterium]